MCTVFCAGGVQPSKVEATGLDVLQNVTLHFELLGPGDSQFLAAATGRDLSGSDSVRRGWKFQIVGLSCC